MYFTVPLGSISELPAESCKEIKDSEGVQAVSGKYWIHSPILGKSVLALCDMETEGDTINLWCNGGAKSFLQAILKFLLTHEFAVVSMAS